MEWLFFIIACALTLLIPAVGIWYLTVAIKAKTIHFWIRLLAGWVLLTLAWQAGIWVYYSVYLKYGFLAAGGVLTLIAIFAGRRQDDTPKRFPWATLLLAVVLIIPDFWFFLGRTAPPDKPVALEFPLKEGKYYILQGGNSLPTNYFHRSAEHQKYAVDIVKLNKLGRRSEGMLPSSNFKYYIYGDSVFCPCNGKVIRSANDFPDETPPTMDAKAYLGNHIVLDCDGNYVIMGHFIPGSVRVKEGEVVATGQHMARIGNSGNSMEPHLHIQVCRNEGQPFWQSKPIPMIFNGKRLVFNDIINP